MSLRVITAPNQPAVSLEDAKTHLRIDDSDSDAEIVALIHAARDFVEKRTQRILINSELQASFDCFVQEFELPVSPIVTVNSITYIDTNGDEQTLLPEDYDVDTESLVPRIRPSYGKSWPATRVTYNAVKIIFTAGFGENEKELPEGIKQAILLLVGHWYENRETVMVGTTSHSMDFTVDALLNPYSRY